MIVVVGPTGSGKSDLALHLAGRFGGEIVGCDSVQVYRGFDIGTAKTPVGERGGIVHHLVDVAEPEHAFTAGDYQRLARAAVSDIARRGALPIVVGGTGFYLRALLDGLFSGPRRDEALRERLKLRAERRPGSLHRLLRRFDPGAARKIHANDHQKLIRALEVCLQARQPMTALQEAGSTPLSGFRIRRIGLSPPRSDLRARLDLRTQRIYDAGLVDETRGLLDKGIPREAKPLESVGYAEAVAVLDGTLPLSEAITQTATRTRQYAKRQLTWFRADQDITWYEAFGNEAGTQKTVENQIKEFIR